MLRMSETPIELEVGLHKNKKANHVVMKLCLLCSHGSEVTVNVLVAGSWCRAVNAP